MNTPKTFTRSLLKWYRLHKRDLPWRKTNDPYKIWVSEIMLQQTTVNAVIPYYKKWIKTFPTIKSVAQASEQRLLKMWQGLGYYNRVKNLQKAARIISEEYGGNLPEDPDILKKLPGFGPYTVGAVSSIAFDISYPIVDANVRRVMMRQLALEGVAETKYDAKILTLLQSLLPKKHCGDFNQGLMELGALICRSKEPICNVCPVKKNCIAYQKNLQEIIPSTKKKVIKDLEVSLALIKKKNHYLIQKRPSKGLLSDLWEFPGGKIEAKETPQEAVKREVKEELDVSVNSSKHLMNAQHFYTQFRVKLHVFLCEVDRYPSETKKRRWVTKSQFAQYPMPSGSAKIVDFLRSE